MTIRILTGGLQTTVQDMGRMGQQRRAIPVSGAMDRTAFLVGNLLVGNDDNDASLEVSLIGPSITFGRACVAALSGADLEATIDGMPIPVWHPVWIPAASTLRFGRPRLGCRAYLAIGGGVDVPSLFGSRSTYLRGGFGGHEGRALRPGDMLALGAPSPASCRVGRAVAGGSDGLTIARWSIGMSLRPRYGSEPTVRVVAGAHADLLDAPSRAALSASAFRVSSSSDRMGYRLEGVTLRLARDTELMSEGVAFGTIQLPPGGDPIILMADRQTSGGYPRIGEVASVDLPLLAQLKPGDGVRFRFISVERAQALYIEQEQDLAQARAAVALRHPPGST